MRSSAHVAVGVLGVGVLGPGVLGLLGVAPVGAQPNVRDEQFGTYCTPSDPGLEELSGLTFVDGTLYAIGDSGTDHRVAVLDESCGVARWLDVPVDPYDVEDLASYDGDLWLADVGDNQQRRETVALTRMDPVSGQGELHRLVYPDGPHDAETLLIEPGGRPIVVTKELSGVSGLYVPVDGTPVDELSSPGPTPLEKAGEIAFERTATEGGPAFVTGSILATGGAVSGDGTVAAVRTYTDVYMFSVADGDVAQALTRDPTIVALPARPQGEALSFLRDGSLVVASEAAGGALPPVDILSGATSLVQPPPAAEAAESSRTSQGSRWPIGALAAAGVLAVVSLFYAFGRARGRD